ncbi:hypothetical protein PF010_g16268 [Phytophthora fragariae]|uniref:Uncharacterized protein n=1 Tax=Phytophthora fragariae TaxID=53985 RepID=A0A6G0KS28_9STRA|nr:hypothetical protein PF010_g16268 [Phytophthora fragariae]KAE9165144.1 hypothetical protein PF004_g29594 [Phytophthora fragariae]
MLPGLRLLPVLLPGLPLLPFLLPGLLFLPFCGRGGGSSQFCIYDSDEETSTGSVGITHPWVSSAQTRRVRILPTSSLA